MATVIPLRERPDLCDFFARRFESEWSSWYGPGGRGEAAGDLRAFANPGGDLPVAVVALDDSGSAVGIAASAVSLLEREGWSRIDTVIHEGSTLAVFSRAVPGAAASSHDAMTLAELVRRNRGAP